MSAEPLSDILRKLTAGDTNAAEQAFRAYEPLLRSVVRRQFGPRLRAKFDSIDVVQSIWADLLEGFRRGAWSFADSSQLRAFLITAARHRFIDTARRHRRALAHEESAEALDGAACRGQPRPSEVAVAEDLWQRLLEQCPPAHRPVLHLKREGLSAPEIAARTGLHEDSIRRILRLLASRLALDA
jgi:RNA polymerase sigma-70 factor (ECF subfamily)